MLTELAHASIGRDFDAGHTQLHEALRLAEQVPPSPMADFRTARLHGLVGVAEFDAGHFDPAERWFQQALPRLEALGARDQVATIANYSRPASHHDGPVRGGGNPSGPTP